MELEPGEPILGLAPLFHITGLVAQAVVALLLPAPLVLTHRFHPAVVRDAIREASAGVRGGGRSPRSSPSAASRTSGRRTWSR